MSVDMERALAVVEPQTPALRIRTSGEVAAACKQIVLATAMTIQGRKYVKVEGWQAISIAHGCVASAKDVEMVEGGIRAIGQVVRMDDGAVLCTAEGFVGDDEQMWAGRKLYARRAMAQTRAISRACRSAFAHVVVMMNAGLETTPAEEIPHEEEERPAPRKAPQIVLDATPGARPAPDQPGLLDDGYSRDGTIGRIIGIFDNRRLKMADRQHLLKEHCGGKGLDEATDEQLRALYAALSVAA